ncbi:MAG: zinc-binding dehydrogenase [Candidatus Poribacteria bacterium]|nr:zinc-binding dehydrogenase [Candidatus Poribacteria bacterium]
MKAAILIAQRQPLIVDEVELPEQLSYGQVRVKVCYSGICGSQLGEIDGVKGEDKYLPHLLGHEGSGIVEDVGPGVRTVSVGDHVVMHWMKGEGIESETPVYRLRGRRLNAGWVTTFNEYAIISENRVTAIPGDFDLELAPLLGCAVTTGLGVINNNARVKIGESVIIFGAGGVGLSVTQGAAMVSAHPIIAIDRYDNKLELASQFGATHPVHAEKHDLSTEIRAIVGDAGADAVVDTTGIPRLIEMAYALTHPRGRTVLVGVPKIGEDISIHSLPLHFGKVLTGSHGGESNPDEDIPRYIRLVNAGKLNLRDLITDHCRLDDINTVIERMRQGDVAGRCIIKIGSE